MPTKFLMTFVKWVSGLMSAWLLGFFVYIYGIPKTPIDLTSRTDAIVVWTGGPCRITTGVELLNQGLSDKLFVSGVQSSRPALVSRKCMSNLSAETIDQLRDKITYGHTALSTMGNATETSIWAQSQNVKSIRLVTTAIHLPRSLVEFRLAMPEIKVIAHPVNVKRFNHRHWYKDPEIFSKCALEYSKLLVVILGIRPWWRDNLIDDGVDKKPTE